MRYTALDPLQHHLDMRSAGSCIRTAAPALSAAMSPCTRVPNVRVHTRRFGAESNVSSSSSSNISNSSSNPSSSATASTNPLTPNLTLQISKFLSQAPSHPPHPLAQRDVSDLRTNHAGEWGAVRIYAGAEIAARWRLWFAEDAGAVEAFIPFLRRHREAESAHLALMSQLLPHEHRTRLLPVWTAAGLLLGALPMLIGGPVAVQRTVVHVETFVAEHYNEQLLWMQREGQGSAGGGSDDAAALRGLASVVQACCSDEVEHMQEAEELSGGGDWRSRRVCVWLDDVWRWVVASGSAAAVSASRVM